MEADLNGRSPLIASNEDRADGTLDHIHHDEELLDPDSEPVQTKVFKRRFWILIVFSCFAMAQDQVWNTWGPIPSSVEAAYPDHWSDGTVAMMSNWATINFVLYVTVVIWAIGRFGLRAMMLFGCGLVSVGTIVRCFSSEPLPFLVTAHICSYLNGISGILAMAVPPMVAAVWFPPGERTTAVAFIQVMANLGNLLSFGESYIVRSPVENGTHTENDLPESAYRHDIMRLMYIDAGMAGLIFVCTLLYFPDKPPQPPSLTSTIQRTNFKSSLKNIARKWEMWALGFCYGFNLGVVGIWMSVMDFSLFPLGFSQDDVALLGVFGVLATCVSGLLSARLTDYMYGHIRSSIIFILLLETAFFYWFYLLSVKAIPITAWQVYASVIGGLATNYANVPLFFELATEIAFPNPEEVVGGLLTTMTDIVGTIFLVVFLIPGVGHTWVTYVLLASSSVTVLPLLFMKENYTRTSLDRQNEEHLHSS